jgi:hypothetical protein
MPRIEVTEEEYLVIQANRLGCKIPDICEHWDNSTLPELVNQLRKQLADAKTARKKPAPKEPATKPKIVGNQICKKCRRHYDARRLKCSKCGTPNPLHDSDAD